MHNKMHEKLCVTILSDDNSRFKNAFQLIMVTNCSQRLATRKSMSSAIFSAFILSSILILRDIERDDYEGIASVLVVLRCYINDAFAMIYELSIRIE